MTAHMTARTPALTFFAYRTPIGRVTIGSSSEGITNLIFGDPTCEKASSTTKRANKKVHLAFGNTTLRGIWCPSALATQAANELLEYLAGRRRTFDVPLAPKGSSFQLRVWEAMRAIPFGEVRTSAEIARMLGNPAAYRAVGSAAKHNPLAVMVPSHRVVSASYARAMQGPRADTASGMPAPEDEPAASGTPSARHASTSDHHDSQLRAFEQAQLQKNPEGPGR